MQQSELIILHLKNRMTVTATEIIISAVSYNVNH